MSAPPQPFEDAAATLILWMTQGEKLWLLLREEGWLVPIAVRGRLKRCDERYWDFAPEEGGTHYYINVEHVRNVGRVLDDKRTVDLAPVAHDVDDIVYRLVASPAELTPTFPG